MRQQRILLIVNCVVERMIEITGPAGFHVGVTIYKLGAMTPHAPIG
jgi:hypothetical protein